MRESAYQAKLIKDLRKLFPGCFILKNDPGYCPGVPDLSIFWEDMWAMLEVKKSDKETFEPNQEYYLELFDGMSFAACIYPENEGLVLYGLQQSFESRRAARAA